MPTGRALVGGLLLAVLIAVGGCSADDDPVVATVDGLELTEDDVLQSYVDYLITTGQNDTQALRERHIAALVDAYLLGAEAERRGLGDDSASQIASERARRRLLGARFYESTVLDTMAAPTEAEVRAAFTLGSEQRVVRQLYFTSEAAAAEAHARLEAGRPFLEEAQALYDTDDDNAGSLGAVSYWQLDDAFAEAAFSTPVGSYSAPIRSRLGYHIILVEDRLRNPILTEDEFARRRKGVESQLRLRRRRMEGDSFVRDFMEARNVAVNRPALLALQQAIADLVADPLPDAQQQGSSGTRALSIAEQAEVLSAFRPETPIATFTLDGQEQTFTLADYVFWVDVLPPSEVRTRTGASLGRALRNEALARAGLAAGLAEDQDVRHELARQERLRLADALRQQLRRDAPAADTARLGRVARDLRLAPQRTVADFWAVSFPTRAAAETALPRLQASPESARSLAGFRAYEGQEVAAVPSLAAAVQGAPLGAVVLASVGPDQWAALRVSDRRVEASGTGAEALAPFAAEADLLRQLRRDRPVTINDRAMRRVVTPTAVPQARR